MDMIKKIAVTASTMFFVLVQVFSFYVIIDSRQEKLEILKDRGTQRVYNGIKEFDMKIQEMEYQKPLEEYVITYCFRQSMPEFSAIYRGKEEMYNSTSYRFERKNGDG